MLNVRRQRRPTRFDVCNWRWPGLQLTLPDLPLSKWRRFREIRCRQRRPRHASKMLAIAHQGHIYRCAPTMDVAPTTRLIAGPNIRIAPALAPPPPPVPAVAIFVERGHTRLTDVTDPACIAE
uniref:Uncharacterized protein n=1 Tax=Romanomermis culicivorax TaxID=13658 RepID=A0A915K5F7_ROMCU